MSFAVSSYDMPYVGSYSDAETLFNKLTPIRGGDQNVRRFVKRTDRAKILKQEFDNGVEVYAFYYYRTPVAKYYPTHIEIYMGGWNSDSTRNIISGLTGLYVRSARSSDYIPAGFRDRPSDLEVQVFVNDYPIRTSERYKFGYDGKPLEGQELAKVRKYVVNRSRMNEVRKQYKPFIEYMKVMTPMIDIENDNVAEGIFAEANRDYTPRGMSKVLNLACDEKTYWNAFTVMVTKFHGYRWLYNQGTGYSRKRALDINVLLREFDKALKQENHHVLDVVEVN